jgi:heat shock protein HslJ
MISTKLKSLWVNSLLVMLAALIASEATLAAEVPLLENTNWQLVKMTVLGGYVFEPAEPSKYVVNFRTDNRLTGSSDCNEIFGSWFQTDETLKFEPFAPSRRLCAPGSLHNNFALLMRDVQSLELSNEHLLLKTSTEGLVLEFEAR